MDSLERDPLVLLSSVARMLRTRADQLARLQDLTLAQWMILARTERQPGLSQSELAAASDVEPITIVRLLDRLEVRGLIERRRDPDDRRMNRLYPTSAGRAILKKMGSYRMQVFNEMTQGVSENTLEILIDGLLLMKSNLAARDFEPASMNATG